MNTCTCNPEICKCDIGCCPCQDKVAEPKPTPSTSIGETDFVKELRIYAEGGGSRFGIRRAEAKWILDNLKSQPGASSISSEPMPEPSVSDKWLADLIQAYRNEGSTASWLVELQQWRKWAAAKGSR